MAAPAPRLDWQFQLLDLNPSRPTPTLVPAPPPVERAEHTALDQLRATLDPAVAQQIMARVRTGAELLRKAAASGQTAVIPTTLAPVDALLGGGLERGKLVELVSRHTTGRFSIIHAAITAATSIGEAVALIDLGDHFDPQIAAANGVDLRRLLWVRPRTIKEAVMSAEMITSTGFQMVVIDLGLHPLRGRRAPEAAWVRLARSAASHQTALLVSSPYSLTATASEAVMKGCGTRARWSGRGKAPRLLNGIEISLSLEKHRHVRPGAKTTVTLITPEAADSSMWRKEQ